MTQLSNLYRHSLALLTDLYQLTMAQGYWKSNRADQEAVFHLFFRKHPFNSGYTIACGLEYALDYLKNLSFEKEDIEYLSGLTGNDNKPLFEKDFLTALSEMEFKYDIDAVPEGSVVFPHEPLIRVQGPILQCQLVETALLNIINFQSLIATKAARVCHAAKGDPVLEFGLRRAQGIDGGLAMSRAAYIGGCDATSNVLAGKLFGIPVKGTHAHSWVMSFDDELDSFQTYADAMPNNCVFLVDTYDTIDGVRNAITVGKKLREQGFEMLGIRLDSGDLAYLSIEARKLLDAAGFENASIVASNDLDEESISSLKEQGAKISVWGVGTRISTAWDQPALGGVYKLSAIRNTPNDEWQFRIKLSEQLIKSSNPGILQVRRFKRGNDFCGDMIFNITNPPGKSAEIIDPMNHMKRNKFDSQMQFEDLLVPVLRSGKAVYDSPSISEIRQRTKDQLAGFNSRIKRFLNPHEYPAGLEIGLHELKTQMAMKAKK